MRRTAWLIIAVVFTWSLSGCTTTRSMQGSGWAGRTITFKTSELAPAQFDGWTFFWWDPSVKDSETELQYVVLLPDGKEHFVSEDLPVEAGSEARSDFADGIAGGDPRPFQGKHIRIRFHSSKGQMRFSRSADYHYAFYRKDKDGNVDWQEPFKEIPAVRQ
ncbi:MAG: hypothetical protein V3S89_12475 [Desulfobacterales bacterium]